MPVAIDGPVVKLSGGEVLVVGGVDQSGQVSDRTFLFSPATNDWSEARLTHGRRFHSVAALPSGKAMACGGEASINGKLEVTDTCEIFSTSTLEWTPGKPITGARMHFGLVAFDEGRSVLAFGGVSPEGWERMEAPIFNVAQNSWTLTASTNARVSPAGLLLPNGDVLAIGSSTAPHSESADRYEPASASWTPTMGTLRNGSGDATLLNDGRVLFGSGENMGSCQVLDPASNTWSDITCFEAQLAPTLVLLSTGNVLAIGGHSAPVDDAEIYDPQLDMWTAAPPLKVQRRMPQAVLLDDGRLLVIGGWTGTPEVLTPTTEFLQ